MLTRGTRRTVTVMLLTVLFALPTAAQAAAPAAATISSCGSDSVTVAGKVSLSGSSARRARGATLQVRFQALALFGLPRSGAWKTVGKKTKASSQEGFAGLPADSWFGVMSWRFKKGSRTVLSGLAKSEPLRVGRSKGRASCTIAEGVKPVDKTPPSLFIIPSNDAWYHAPATVQLTASDDFSGVKSVSYGVDGGAKQPIGNGSAFQIPDQGAHTVNWEATDVAGNTGTRSAIVRVDGGPPSKPAFSRPFSVTSTTTPQFTWSTSVDSGSGMRGYVLIVKRASDNAIVIFQTVDANTTSVGSPVTLTDGETYTATVTAVDNTADTPWTIGSDPLTFRVDSHADATSFTPVSGTILSGSANSTNFTITLDRAANSSTVSPSTVKLTRGGSDVGHSAGCSNTPCTVIVVDPTSNLGEGRYTLTLNGVQSADENLAFSGSATYAVPYTESGSIPAATLTSLQCAADSTATATSPSSVFMLSQADAGTTAFLDFDIAGFTGGGWSMQAVLGSTPIGNPLQGAANGSFRLNFPAASSGNLHFELTVHCGNSGGASASASNLFGSRYP